MICVGRDVLEQVTENRIMTVYRFMCVTVAREVVVHDAFNDVIEEFAAHFFKQAFFGLKMSVECASSNVGQVNDVLNSDLCIRFSERSALKDLKIAVLVLLCLRSIIYPFIF